MKTSNIVIFASGSGSNAEAIAHYFATSDCVCVRAIVSNRANAGVGARARSLGIPFYHFSSAEMAEGSKPIALLAELHCHLIVLAGYMCLITEPYLRCYHDRILNIHPALLPKYGGQGMYGHHVHEAVLESADTLSGITIHLIDAQYDHGRTICQATCPILPTDTSDILAQRIHILEHRFYPVAIEQYLTEVLELQNP